MLLDTLGATLLENMLAGKGANRAEYDSKGGKWVIRVGYGSKLNF